MKHDLGAYVQENAFIGECVYERASCVLETLRSSGWDLHEWRMKIDVEAERIVEVIFTVTTLQVSDN